MIKSDASFKLGEQRPEGKMAWEIYGANDLPETVDWRNKDGINYLSWTKN
jgi:hypothetical protein